MDIKQSTKSLWDFADDIEGACVELERLQYMLQILDEGLEKDLSFLDKQKAQETGAYYYVSRYDLHRAQLGMIELWLNKTRHEVEELSNELRKCHKAQEATA